MVNIWPFISQLAGSVCPLCHAPGDGLCGNCLDTLPRNRHACPRCALPLPADVPGDAVCAHCLRYPPAFDRAVAPLLYVTPTDDLVARFKYHQQLHIGRVLADILVAELHNSDPAVDLLLPVPALAARLNDRGFNQAAELTARLADAMQIPWSTRRLSRLSHARHQRGLTRKARRRAVRGAFASHGALPARVGLIDDVVTTGATADEASRVLKQAGAQWVEVWSVARTPLGGGY